MFDKDKPVELIDIILYHYNLCYIKNTNIALTKKKKKK